jgi:hypothetical protein
VDFWSAFMHSSVLKKINELNQRLVARYSDGPVKVNEMAEAYTYRCMAANTCMQVLAGRSEGSGQRGIQSAGGRTVLRWVCVCGLGCWFRIDRGAGCCE